MNCFGNAFFTLLLLASPAGADATRHVFLPANDLVYDSATHRIYASVPASADSPGRIAALDPETGQIGPSVPIGGQPGRLAMADQGRYLYVGLDDVGAVCPFDTVIGTAGVPFSLGSGTGPNLAEDMVVAPRHPETLAVARYTQYIHPRSEGVAIYDNGVPRPKETAHRVDAANSIAFGATAGRLYGFENETTDFHFYRWGVDESGIGDGDILSLMHGVFRILFDSGRLYATNGSVYDPEAGTLLGTLPPGEVRPDSARGRVYVLQGTGYNALLLTCDVNTFRQLGAVRFAGVSGTVGSLIHWGTDGVAFRTGDGRIFLIHTDQLAPQRIDLSLALSTPAVRVGGTVTGTLTLLTAAPPGGLTVTLGDSRPGIVRHPATVTVPEGSTQVLFSLTEEAVTAATTDTITAFTAGGTASAPLQVFPDASASGNLLVNSSFEQPDVSSSLYNTGYTYGPEPASEITTQYRGVGIPGWRITHGDIKLVQRRWPAIDGGQSIDLMGGGEGRIEQSLPTEPGREYVFSGYMSHHPQLGGGFADVYLNGKFFVQMQHAAADMDWSFFTLRFRAAEPVTTLTISDVTATGSVGGLVLDGLSVTPAGTPLARSPKARPAPPTGLTAQSDGHAIVLEWENNSDDVTGFVIRRRPYPRPPAVPCGSPP